ncbi:hypothetical protein SEA_ARACELI_77 [Streptomyces phage Araceli]|nr:hypothetical protein SEA_HENOCCUS_78 [Streptomyces phage Henoccus]AWY07396.1 hypothetical protein SEA_JACKIEB_78 [Streptomyces phage JackieB]QFG07891.1 hypothetical protein SEA_ARACELI_77 [Streptomyces phage Araceli]
MAECNGICLTPADIGLPEYSAAGIAYAHPDCPEHGDPLEDREQEICIPGYDEDARYVREEDVAHAEDRS